MRLAPIDDEPLWQHPVQCSEGIQSTANHVFNHRSRCLAQGIGSIGSGMETPLSDRMALIYICFPYRLAAKGL